MKTRELKELKLTKNIIIPFPNFQQNTIISPTQMNDNFEEIEYAYNNLIDNHNGALEKINKVLSDLTSSDNEAIVNEQERVKAEETRVNNEEERIANEEERKTEETKRIAMYNIHLNDEIRREQKHIQMVGEFDTKVDEVDTLINTKTEEYNSFVETKTEEYNTFVETKEEEYDTFVKTKETEVQDAINSIPPKSELIGEKGDKGDKGEKGDKGDRGEQGLQGIQGIQGVQGLKGDKGDKGEQGIQGLKGDKGDKGDRGEQGVKGDTPSITHLETSINNKIQEVETRFNTLTSAQQQSSEVIDARDGETSLKARLDRDIEKAKQVYVNVEGSHISTDSSSGYLKDVEILGNTIQDEEDLADIRSVGEKVEGQELYEIPVLCSGKNLLKIPDNSGTSCGIIFTSKDGLVTVNGTNTGYVGYDLVNGVVSDKLVSYSLVQSILDYYSGVPNFINKPGNYIIKIDSNIPIGELTFSVNILYDDDKHLSRRNSSSGMTSPLSISVDSHINGIYIGCWYSGKNFNNVQVKVQIEEGTVATPYEPYQEDKLTILSPVQLEKVGDVRDRIIEKDGVWGVEKNVGTKVFDGSENWSIKNQALTLTTRFGIQFDDSKGGNILISNRLPNKTDGSQYTTDEVGISINNSKLLCFRVLKTELSEDSVNGGKKWLSQNNLLVKYPTAQPTFIPLPHDQQLKLRTFASKTNISFLTEIEGTIKAQVPKSLGATVNTHTTQIDNLNKELDRVKKLEESTVSTVETESDFTTVEATSNGYFEDVKLEGKTLVNLASMKGAYIRKDTGNVVANSSVPLLQGLKANTTYTRIINVSKLNLGTIDRIRMYDSFTDVNGVYKQYPWSYITTTGVYMNTFTIGDADTLPAYIINPNALAFNGTTGAELEIDKMVILEGDHTQNPPSFFEGLKSVGDGADEIVVSSVNGGNLFDKNNCAYNINGGGYYISNYININDKLYYDIYKNLNASKGVHYEFLDKNKKRIYINYNVSHPQSGIIENTYDAKYIRLHMRHNTTITKEEIDNNYGVIVSSSPIKNINTPHQSDKKRLLYYNEETQSWEKPILREWDSIEKHADGKYYYHQRSAEVVFDGSEDWSITSQNDTTICFNTNAELTYVHSNEDAISDKFLLNKGITSGDILAEGFKCSSTWKKPYVRILKSKLSTQDVAGFKQWLQANNTTVVYQLAEEKVYECTNIDLITYANETNYIVESGAIAPKTTLKVHNNISNVVNILQEKVSLLENKFIEGLKQVLAGDMYSLAELLYPEDFVSEEEPIDVPTLLI